MRATPALVSLLCGLWCLGELAPVRADEAPPPSLWTPVPPAEPGPPVGWALGAGTATALVPMAIGGALFASSYDVDRRNAAAMTMAWGLGLAPIVSHLVVREWSRAGIFGAIPIACAIGVTVLTELQPTVTVYGTREGRFSFGMLMSFDTLAAGIGLFDTLGARGRAAERRRKRARAPVVPAPFLTRGGGGLAVGGLF